MVSNMNLLEKFSQLYKVHDDKYLLDLQRVNGPQFLFLEFCSIFIMLLEAS